MTTLTTRATKGSELSYTEGDNNFKRQAQAKTADYTCVVGDNRDTIEFDGTDLTATLPAATTISASANTGDYEVTLKNLNATDLTVARSSTDTIDGATSYALKQYECLTFKANQAGDGYNVSRGIFYKEGTFTPTISASTSGTATVSNAIGEYTKVGNVVTFTAFIVLSSKGTLSGNIIIGGLPYACSSAFYYFTVGLYGGLSTSVSNIVAHPVAGTLDTLYLGYLAAGGGTSWSLLADSDIGDTFGVIINGSYLV